MMFITSKQKLLIGLYKKPTLCKDKNEIKKPTFKKLNNTK